MSSSGRATLRLCKNRESVMTHILWDNLLGRCSPNSVTTEGESAALGSATVHQKFPQVIIPSSEIGLDRDGLKDIQVGSFALFDLRGERIL